jgi:Tfp pilus assembly protein PilF
MPTTSAVANPVADDALNIGVAAAQHCADAAAFTERGEMSDAIACYTRAVAAQPALLELHLLLANAHLLIGDELAARATLRAALTAATRSSAEREFALGKALVDAGAGADAVPCFRRVRKLRPRDGAAIAAHAAALRDAGELAEAWREITAALKLTPRDPAALLTAARIRHDAGDLADALRWCERSLTLRPDSRTALLTRGYLRYLLGDERGAWQDFESRAAPVSSAGTQPWRGESLSGRSIALLGEQGIGDQLQFVRYARHHAFAEADRVVVAVTDSAVTLLRSCGYDVVSRDSLPATDFCAPLLSLPHLLDVDAAWRGDGTPYLALNGRRKSHTAERVFRVGVTWAGNPSHRNDAVRSLPAHELTALFQSHPNVDFVAFQHEITDAATPHGFSDTIIASDWLDTARALQDIDLLITVDTGIAHLAGALGIPVWIMLPFVPDWRWGVRGDTTSWYDSARLFRQPKRGDWGSVIRAVNGALSYALELRRSS